LANETLGGGRISVEIPSSPLTITAQPRDVDLFSIFDFELDVMSESFSSLSLAFTGITVGVALSLGVTLVTIDDLQSEVHATFAGVTVAAVLLSFFFGWRAILDWQKARSIAKAVRKRPAS